MSFEAQCPQCRFVSQQLGQATPCLLHVALPVDLELTPEQRKEAQEDYDEPYTFGELRVSVDRPGPFTLREYVRLQLLRTRIQAEPSALDAPTPRTQARSLLRR